LYRLLLDIWAAAPINAHTDHGEVGDLDRARGGNLDAISLRPRIAFLLNALEGFDVDEVARTLDVSPHEASALIERPTRKSQSDATDVLIIEDEPLIADDLREVVEESATRHRLDAHP